MGIFDDKQYEEMDWLTRAIEPTISKINDILHSIPEEIEINHDTLMKVIKESWGDIDFSSVVSSALEPYTIELSRQDRDNIHSCFRLYLPENLCVDLIKNTITGPQLKIVKHKTIFEEEELKVFMGREGLHRLYSMDPNDTTIERCNEIAELLGCSAALSKRSLKQKLGLIVAEVSKCIKDGTWNIKNVELSNKVCIWIKEYLVNGNLPSLTNFCKFKVMTHNGDAIYSIEEEPT